MNEETYLKDFNKNLERLRGVFEEYNSADRSLEQLNAVTDDIEGVFEDLVSENEELDGRLRYRKDQSEVYQEIIEDMSERIDEIEETSGEDFDIDYLLDGLGSLFNEYLSEIDRPTRTEFSGLYKSPIINVVTSSHGTSQISELDQGRYKSPVINVESVSAAQSTSSRIDSSLIPDSWDEYSLGGGLSDPGFSGEPEFDSPGTYLESRGVELGEGQADGSVSINVSYGGAGEDDLIFLNSAS